MKAQDKAQVKRFWDLVKEQSQQNHKPQSAPEKPKLTKEQIEVRADKIVSDMEADLNRITSEAYNSVLNAHRETIRELKQNRNNRHNENNENNAKEV